MDNSGTELRLKNKIRTQNLCLEYNFYFATLNKNDFGPNNVAEQSQVVKTYLI